MTHKDIFTVLKNNFSAIAEKTTEWFPCGKNCIRIRGKFNGVNEIIFTYCGSADWRIESTKHYISTTMKGEK